MVRVSAHIALLTSLISAQAAVFQRQTDLTDPSTGLAEAPGTAPTVPPAASTVTEIVIITPSVTPPALGDPIISSFIVTYTESGHTSLSTATVTLNPTFNIPHGVSTPFVPSVTQSVQEHDTSNKGAIAGGVIGALAVIVAAFGAFVWFRRRSPKHWRNRTAGRWQNFDSKTTGGARNHPVYMGEPIHRIHSDSKRTDPNPLPPLYIRDRQPPAVGDPFEDERSPPTSPRGHSRIGSISNTSHHHHHRGSSLGGFEVELQPTTGSSPR